MLTSSLFWGNGLTEVMVVYKTKVERDSSTVVGMNNNHDSHFFAWIDCWLFVLLHSKQVSKTNMNNMQVI